MEYFPKSLVFWKRESSALTILLKAEGEPLPRKNNPQYFSQRTLACAVWSKAEEKLLFFPFCPPHKKLVREKLPNSILGLAMSRLLKWRELLFFFNQW